MTTPNKAQEAPVKLTIKDGAVATKGLRFKNRTVTTGVTIHCSATRPSQDFGAVDVDRMHRTQGWLCIGYHLVIRRDGTVEMGRPLGAVGSHCKDGGRNNTNVGVCLIGGVSENPLSHKPGWPWNGSDSECNFTDAQKMALPLVLDYLRSRYPTIATFEGHRDVPGVQKACPSFNVAQWLRNRTWVN